MNLKKALFWDVDYDKIDFEKNAGFVISRVIMRGTWNEWLEIQQFYGKKRIMAEMLEIRYLDKYSLNFCSFYFNIPVEQFRWYTVIDWEDVKIQLRKIVQDFIEHSSKY